MRRKRGGIVLFDADNPYLPGFERHQSFDSKEDTNTKYKIGWRDRANPKKHGKTNFSYNNREAAESKLRNLQERLSEYDYTIEEVEQ
jgi:hypothetical protein